ncbi:hypothetical protein EG329_009663 [Mollisiaceae sp. DMI_Dod_QoI]|nr:hypothetical protein EG329_009663 [Helotiales sp. DMI_Dod_QoI]
MRLPASAGDMARSENHHDELDADDGHVTKDFHHPYTPYAIQETFMGTVYDVLEAGKVGILESPTGTGKSLSLICGSLTWLRDFKGRAFEEGLNWNQDGKSSSTYKSTAIDNSIDSDEPAWVIEQAKARKRREMLRQREDMEARLARIRTKEKAQRDKYLKGDQGFKRRKVDSEKSNEDDEEQFVLEDYDSDQEQNGSKGGKSDGVFSAATLELMAKIGMGPLTATEEEDEAEDAIKVFYCSRTHSQLTQFINELRRVNFPPSIKDANIKDTDIEDIKHLTLGSRKNLCINPSVNKLHSVTAINERCAELQQSSTAKEHKCAFLPNKENQALVNTFQDHALATIRDIEDMGSLGKEIGICPYYASRSAIKPSEIVTLPYPLLLQKSAREALGISLKGHVVIIDEAHNLMDAISGIHGVEKADGVVSDKELLAGKGVDQINLFKLIRYLNESKLARKVESYALHTSTQIPATSSTTKLSQQAESTSSTPVLHHISSLLSALTHPSKEGRLFFTKSSEPTTPDLIMLKFLLLDPSTSFQEIVSQARSVILAGGTMSPMSDYTSHLFPYLPSTSITTLSCGHVIPKSNLVAWNLSKGPGGKEFEFTYSKRGDAGMIDELGLALLNICSVVPDGVVVFFPSYAYLALILARWSVPPPSPTPSASPKSILQRLEAKKVLFKESKETGVDTILQDYAAAIESGKGGLLLSVVGGKMSEGINFSDRLGRCVLIVGLPFPNAASAEWKAKLSYIESSTISRLSNPSPNLTSSSDPSLLPTPILSDVEIQKRAKDESRSFYENACMRAVNQSVGRAIRHRNDYAAIVMVDKRFGNERIKGKLPGWIREGLVEGAGEKNFGALMGSLSAFFRGKKNVVNE